MLRYSHLALSIVFIAFFFIQVSLHAQENRPDITTNQTNVLEPVNTTNESHRYAINGLYPLWESTGLVLKHQEIAIGTRNVQIGLLNRFHIGVQPGQMIGRTPNVQFKLALVQEKSLAVATQVATYTLLPRAGESFFSPVFASRLQNDDTTVWLLPLSTSVTWAPVSWYRLHQTFTILPLLAAKHFKNRADVGYSMVHELSAHNSHALLLHAGEIGLWNHDIAYFGASYRFNYSWFELAFGYFYRLSPSGSQSSPLVTLTAWL